MRNALYPIRRTLVKELKSGDNGRNDYLLQQRGMFIWVKRTVEHLRDEFGVYLIASGRMSPGNALNVHRVAGVPLSPIFRRRTAITVPSGLTASCCDHHITFRNKTADNPSFDRYWRYGQIVFEQDSHLNNYNILVQEKHEKITRLVPSVCCLR